MNDLETKDFYKNLLDNINEKVFLINKDYEVIYFNKPAEKSFLENITQEEKLFCYKLSHGYNTPCSEHGVLCPLEEVIKTGEAINIVHEHGEGDNKIWEDISCTPIKNKKSEVTHVLEAMTDTTDLHKSTDDIHNILKETIVSLSKTIEKRDPYTSGHQSRTSQLALAIAKELELEDEEIALVEVASCLHDIGKIKTPAEILTTPARLDKEEYALIKQHSQTGYEIIKDIPFDKDVAKMILQHHESYNGTGYPQGLKEDEILLGARIIKVADTVEAMMTHRPYRAALGQEAALYEIDKNRGILYDSNVVNACINIFKKHGFKFVDKAK